jgi:hypothetical protein
MDEFLLGASAQARIGLRGVELRVIRCNYEEIASNHAVSR